MRLTLVAPFIIAAMLSPGTAQAGPAKALEVGPSGNPLPRFVSLGSGRVNVRVGPSFDYKVKWTFQKKGLPVEIVREFGNWRRVRDVDGEQGWVHFALLSGERTALVGPWAKEPTVLRVAARAEAPVAAYLEPMVLATVDECDGAWCAISGAGWRGHVPQASLWGVYPNEEID